MIISKKLQSLSLGLFLTAMAIAQGIPQQPNPPRLVNDFAGLLNPSEAQSLESKLVAFDDSTSTQIAVVIVSDLKGYDSKQFAYDIAHTWKIGQKGKNNGIIILIKPKTQDSRGEVAIQTGYGMEHLITDALSKRIIELEMIPFFKQDNYYAGIDAAVNAVMLASKGQYKGIPKNRNNAGGKFGFILIIFLIIIIVSFLGKRKTDANQHTIGSNLPWWLLMGGIMSSSGRGNDWGNFSGGSGGGDSFGGFGGGDFGGGGASGSW
jgi:uncharacterized protein